MISTYLYTQGRGIRLTFNVLCFISLLALLTSCDMNSGKTPPVQPNSSIQCSTHSSSPVTLAMYYGSEKQTWIDAVVNDFNSRHITACDGPITVKAIPIGSGQSMQEMINGTIQPDIWSPAGSIWLNLINLLWQKKYGRNIVSTGATDTPSLVLSPVVIAMWEPEARALGWPNKAIGWADIAALSTNPRGWAAYGHPEWGDFKFGHTHPDFSNSGLDAIIAEYYAALGKVRGLTVNDVESAKARDFVGTVESSVIHYGESTGFFADEMFNKGPSYLSAAVMYESLVVQANEGKLYSHLASRVVAIYPKEGTFYSDHPFVIPQTSWVTPAKKAAALVFRNFLLAPEQQQKALQYGFRPGNLKVKIAAPIDSAHGVDLSQPSTTLAIPSAGVVNAIETSWEELRRRVDVMLISDRSGSMNEQAGGVSKIEAAKQSLLEFVNLLSASDGLGLTAFSDNAEVLTPVTPVGPKRQEILKTISEIIANGSTQLYNTIAEQVQALEVLPSKHIKAVIVLTDGQDTVHQLSLDQLLSKITSSGENAGEGIKVFTIAYGKDADADGLRRIATATGGQECTGTPQNIRQIYLLISEFFGVDGSSYSETTSTLCT
jgi:Ca-activated chloride channel homolog